jgi:hypothetical protein
VSTRNTTITSATQRTKEDKTVIRRTIGCCRVIRLPASGAANDSSNGDATNSQDRV